jgi:uncharacterized membrane protein YhaH (DUF805 family)
MDFMNLYTNFSGRIGRQSWWIGTIILLVVAVIISFFVMPLIGMSMMAGFDPTAGADAIPGMMRKAAIIQIVITAIFAYPATALMKKRLNDRDRPAWYVYVFWAPTVLNLLLGLTGLSHTMTDMGGMMMPQPSGLGWVVNIASLAIGIWALVELGFLRGTQGPNQHGPDPVAG